MHHRRFLVLAAAAALAAFPGPRAQLPCGPANDGFDPGCCLTPVPNLPAFPAIQMQANYACISNCAPTAPLTSNVQVSAPSFFLCDYAVATVTFSLPGGSGFTGALLMKYARTWREFSPVGTGVQVWRFLVNGDLTRIGPGLTTNICPIPPCSLPPSSLPVHWVGSIDYACGATTTTPFAAALNLNHLVGCLFHAPFSSRPLAGAAGHPTTSYHLVGPAPFAFGATPEPQGPIIDDAVRTSRLNWTPFLYQCVGEAPVRGGALNTVHSDCLCAPIAPLVGPYRHQDLNGTVCCNGLLAPFGSVPLPGTPVPTGFVAQVLGNYAGAAGTFPGARGLTIYVGVLQNAAPCGPAPNVALHIVTGVATSQVLGQAIHVTPNLCGPTILPVPTTWIDLGNMLVLSTATAASGPLPGIGSLFGTTVVWSLDTP